MRFENVLWLVVFSLLIVFLPQRFAYAYLDPGTGSLIVQIIVAGALGIAVSIKLFWGNIVGFFKQVKRPHPCLKADR